MEILFRDLEPRKDLNCDYGDPHTTPPASAEWWFTFNLRHGLEVQDTTRLKPVVSGFASRVVVS